MKGLRAPLGVFLAAGVGLAAGFALARAVPAGPGQGGESPDRGRFRSPSGTEIELLLSESDLGGGELQVGEITFPPGADSGDHRHGATEVFYVLEGELEHVVDGVSERLGPGDLGFVRPPSVVNHKVAPGGPAARRAGDLGARRGRNPDRRELGAPSFAPDAVKPDRTDPPRVS